MEPASGVISAPGRPATGTAQGSQRHSVRTDDLLLVAPRVVHGGKRFIGPTLLDPEALKALQQLVPLGTAAQRSGPEGDGLDGQLAAARPQWACFDNAFNCTLPPEASTDVMAQAWRSQGLCRFSFHGLSYSACQ
jgi:acetate kinase